MLTSPFQPHPHSYKFIHIPGKIEKKVNRFDSNRAVTFTLNPQLSSPWITINNIKGIRDTKALSIQVST